MAGLLPGSADAGCSGCQDRRVTDHEPGCPLNAAPWLRDAVAAGHPADPGAGNETFVDRAVTGALTDALTHMPELDIWAEAGLAAVLRHAAPADDELRLAWCTCRRGTDPAGGQP
jgi:hypothetical protein